MRRFAIGCLIFSITFLLVLAGVSIVPQKPGVTSVLNHQFKDIHELKEDLARIDMRLNRISRGGGRTMGATTEDTPQESPGETPEEAQPEAQESETQEDQTGE